MGVVLPAIIMWCGIALSAAACGTVIGECNARRTARV